MDCCHKNKATITESGVLVCKYSTLFWYELLHVSGVAVPDLPVMYSGGVLHIQSHSLSAETLFQLSQSAALLAAVCLQDQDEWQ